MVKLIKESDFILTKIDKEFWENFKPMRWNDLSDANCFTLRVIGDAIRPNGSQHFWSDGSYSWFVDERQDYEQRVWMTVNGTVMFEDCTANELFRVEFRY